MREEDDSPDFKERSKIVEKPYRISKNVNNTSMNLEEQLSDEDKETNIERMLIKSRMLEQYINLTKSANASRDIKVSPADGMSAAGQRRGSRLSFKAFFSSNRDQKTENDADELNSDLKKQLLMEEEEKVGQS